MKNLIRQRICQSYKPALIHLGVSFMVALLAAVLIFKFWYPAPLSSAQGVNRLVLIMICVDVVIGPLITLIVYAPAKKSLHFDLATIAALQTIALLYGLQAVNGGRPAYLVFNVDRFDVVAIKEVVPASLALADPQFGISWFGPRWVAARLPVDGARRTQILFSAAAGGADLPQMPEFFVPLEHERPQMLKRIHSLVELRQSNELDDAEWQALIDTFDRPESAMGYLPMRANVKDGAVILDAKTGEVLGIRLLTPRFEAPPRAPARGLSPQAPSPSTRPAPSRSLG